MRSKRTVAESLQALKRLDLQNVKRKLKEPAPEGKGWTEAQAEAAEKWYRRFLEVIARFPNLNTVPNYVIDMFWHQHILDTRAYAADCEAIFGCFIHHYPYFGLNGDAEQRDDCFEQTDDVYQRIFGETCKQIPEFTMVSKGKECAALCNNAKGEDCNTSACRADDGAIPRPAIIGAVLNLASRIAECIGDGPGTCAASKARFSTAAVPCGGGPCTPTRKSEGKLVEASNCNSGGSGTGCGQGCGSGYQEEKQAVLASGCNSKGSGTGCGQSCGRGK